MSSTKRLYSFSVKNSSKANRFLLIINVVLFFGALVIAILDLNLKEYTPAVAMLFVMFLTAVNAYGCWKRLKGKKL